MPIKIISQLAFFEILEIFEVWDASIVQISATCNPSLAWSPVIIPWVKLFIVSGQRVTSNTITSTYWIIARSSGYWRHNQQYSTLTAIRSTAPTAVIKPPFLFNPGFATSWPSANFCWISAWMFLWPYLSANQRFQQSSKKLQKE